MANVDNSGFASSILVPPSLAETARKLVEQEAMKAFQAAYGMHAFGNVSIPEKPTGLDAVVADVISKLEKK